MSQVAAEVPASAKGKGGKGFSATVPVYFHVVTPDGVTGNVTLAQIKEEIRVMSAGNQRSRGRRRYRLPLLARGGRPHRQC